VTSSLLRALALLVLVFPRGISAQGVKIAVGDVGIGIGDVPRIDGLRLNFRDDALERVRGINATIWSPREGIRGTVKGLALGVPVTGGARVAGLGVGVGVGAEDRFTGIGLAPIGIGAGGDVRGIAVGGVGIGAGEDVTGVMIGGVGAGAGGDVKGLLLGGVGVGGGEDLTGAAVGGLGVGAGGDVTGAVVGGVGVGAGGELRGLGVGGVGVGVGRLTGLAVAGFGVGGREVVGVALAPAYARITEGGLLRGVTVAAFNHVQGEQRGLTIGVLNVARELHGVQVGLVNIAWNKPSWRVLPLVNYHP